MLRANARTRGAGLAICFILASAAALAAAQDDGPVVDPPAVGPPADPVAALSSAPESAAALEAQAAAEVSATVAQVAADKDAAKAALANPDAAWDAFLASQQTQIAAAKASSAGDPLPQHLSVLDADIAAGPRALAKRKQVFVRNLRDINKRNAGSGDMLAFGVNGFSALSPKEFKKIYLSSIIPPTDSPKDGGGRKLLQTSNTLQCSKQVAFPFGSLTPRTIAQATTPPRDQKQCGSCAAFAAMSAIEPAFIAKWSANGWNTGNTDLAEQDLLSCTSGDGCQGAWPSVYIDRVTCKGAPYESTEAYRASDTVACPSVTRYTSGVVNWANVPNNERGFAQALLHNPFAIGISGNELQSYSSGVYNCGGNNPMNHAITVVGYTKGVRMNNGQTWNVFRVKNSWGGGWGESGFVRFRANCGGTGSLKMYQYQGILPIRG